MSSLCPDVYDRNVCWSLVSSFLLVEEIHFQKQNNVVHVRATQLMGLADQVLTMRFAKRSLIFVDGNNAYVYNRALIEAGQNL